MQTHKQPVTEYEAIREKSAIQKHELEKSLIKFLIKTGPTESLFLNQENDCFPCKYHTNIFEQLIENNKPCIKPKFKLNS